MLKIINLLIIIIPVLISVAFLTVGERKIMGRVQRRVGPNEAGFIINLVWAADGLKLFLKETISPRLAIKGLFFIAPILTFFLSLFIWVILPFNYLGETYKELPLSLLMVLAISSLNVYSLLFSGWASNSKYSFLGSLRAIAQLVSYEVSIGIILMSLICFHNTFNLNEFLNTQIYISNFFFFLPIFFLFFLNILSELNRSPFDLSEAESELVSGYNTDYSGFAFAAFYLAEYTFILFWSSIISILLFGSIPSSFSNLFILFLIILIRAITPRLRYDQLLSIGWTGVLPLSISYFILVFSISYSF